MILRCLPPEVLAAELSEFEANGSAANEIGIPMHMILGQLPSGKVEIPFQELVPLFPVGYLQPTESIASYLPNIINLPLMDVVMRIPPDLLALRPDQKDVDASIINMADPFTEEILREQAETASRQSQANIIEESQAPQEEFVPRNQAETTKSAPLPKRSPTASVAMPSTSGRISSPAPIRPTSPLPPRSQETATYQRDTLPAEATAPVPPVPRHTGSIPAPPVPRHTTTIPSPPPPRHTTTLPSAFRRTGPVPMTSKATPSIPQVPASAAPATAEQTAAAVATGAPDAGADDLQRLAALAMTELGESSESPTESTPKSEPIRAPEPRIEKAAPAPVVAPFPAIHPRSIPSPEPPVVAEPRSEPLRAPVPSSTASLPPAQPKTQPAAQANASMAFNLNTCTAEDLIQNIPEFTPELAESIIQYRTKIGSFKRLEDLLDVPGITKDAYTNLTGEAPPANRIPLSLNELLGFPADQNISLKDVTERIACWPDVTGCVLSQNSGLSLVGTVPDGVSKSAIVAFAPRMFESINKSFSEVSGQETDALVIPSSGTSFHLFRNKDLYLIIMSRLPQMPERHMKVARYVLAALSIRRE